MAVPDVPCLCVNGEHLAHGMRVVARRPSRVRGPGLWTFSAGELIVDLGELTFRASASGSWNGTLKIKQADMRALAKKHPAHLSEVWLRVEADQMLLSAAPDFRSAIITDGEWTPTPVEEPNSVKRRGKLPVSDESEAESLALDEWLRQIAIHVKRVHGARVDLVLHVEKDGSGRFCVPSPHGDVWHAVTDVETATRVFWDVWLLARSVAPKEVGPQTTDELR